MNQTLTDRVTQAYLTRVSQESPMMMTSLIPATLLIIGATTLFIVMSFASVLAPGEPDEQDFSPKVP